MVKRNLYLSPTPLPRLCSNCHIAIDRGSLAGGLKVREWAASGERIP